MCRKGVVDVEVRMVEFMKAAALRLAWQHEFREAEYGAFPHWV